MYPDTDAANIAAMDAKDDLIEEQEETIRQLRADKDAMNWNRRRLEEKLRYAKEEFKEFNNAFMRRLGN